MMMQVIVIVCLVWLYHRIDDSGQVVHKHTCLYHQAVEFSK